MDSSAGESQRGEIFPDSSRLRSFFPDCSIAVQSWDVFLVLEGMSRSGEQHWKGAVPTGLPIQVSSVTLPLGEGPGVGVGE